jgi:RNA polymerase sigma factor (sigma-70 family)
MTTPTSSDANLVAGHLAGDPGALAGIYDRYADSLHDTAAAMLNDRSEAADVLQDVILVAAERLEQLRDPERLKPWLFAILRNEVYRRTKNRRRTIGCGVSE